MDLLLQTLPAGTNVPPTTGALSTDELSNSTETATLTSYEEIIGSEYIDEVEQLYKHTIGDDGITAEELEHLRVALRSTTRPTWQRGPPMNFGSAAHVLLAQLWSFSDAEVLIDERKRRRRLVLASTMLLATAIWWGTSDVASQAHAENYTQHMKAYLDILLHLYPAFKLKPNHHAALHIGFFLREFGPMRGWWMYPFERIIGILQKTNTNSKLGQMEKTMLQSFCAAANLKALLRGSEIPAVNQCASQVEKISELFSPDGNVPEAIAARGNDVSSREQRAERLHPDIQAALMAKEILWKSRINGWRTPTQAFRHRRITVGAFEFASYTESRSLGSIFFKPDDSQILTPGRIQEIFAVETQGHDGVGREDILMLGVFEEFGAHIWPSDLSDQLDIVPFTGALYHSIGRSWSEGMVVLKPMNRAFGKRDFSDTDHHV
ncbi:hypothetical protein FIBSPDRAFT_949702 [Athelia psychrophila]|uniref:DUF4218 domain-containing protein n=1 Tax=Athelia psychrophila TaxID=1759441 RepID=A0A166PM29_9AGAM|nr:hypothetical protein FIBSPDRAFT_949702 [Fibularhizoctonia sp. CBS 109695]